MTIHCSKESHVDYREYDDSDDAVRHQQHRLEVERMTDRLDPFQIHSTLAYATSLGLETAACDRLSVIRCYIFLSSIPPALQQSP